MNVHHAWVLGGGFAGIQAARSLLRRAPDVRVTILDRNDYSTMIPALPDVLSGKIKRVSLETPLSHVVPRRHRGRVTLRQGEVRGIDLEKRTITVDGTGHRYDSLVIAHGSSPQFSGFSATSGTLHTVHTLKNARALRSAFTARAAVEKKPVPIVIVGAGYTGLEVAAALRHGADAAGVVAPTITVVEAAKILLPFLDDSERDYLRAYFRGLDINVLTNATVTAYREGTAVLSDGREIPDALVCWAAGMTSHGPEITGEIERTRDGRIRTNEYLQLAQYPEVFVAGDAAAIEKDGSIQRRAVNFAYYSGRAAGHNLARFIAGATDRLKTFRPVDLGWVIPLGGASVGHVLGPFRVRGRLGLRMHYAMCGFRHFRFREALEFYATALALTRMTDPLRDDGTQ